MDLLETQVSDLRSFLRQPQSGQAAQGQQQDPTRRPSATSVASSPINAPPPMGMSPSFSHQPDSTGLVNAALSPAGSSASPTAGGIGGSGNSSNSKRKHTEDAEELTKQQRSKRNRYISIACNECKRRKIKCNGESPCQRCGNLNLACLYAPNCCPNSFKDSEEYKRMAEQMAGLQDQVNSLFDGMSALRQETLRLAPIHHGDPRSSSSLVLAGSGAEGRSSEAGSSAGGGRPPTSNGSVASTSGGGAMHGSSYNASTPGAAFLPRPKAPAFRGPTSKFFAFGVAKTTLSNMGFSPDGVGEENGEDGADNGHISGSNDAIVMEQLEPIVGTRGVGDKPAQREGSPRMARGTGGGGSSGFSQELPPPPLPMAAQPLRAPDPLWQYNRDEIVRLIVLAEEELGIMYPVLDFAENMRHALAVAAYMETVRGSASFSPSMMARDGGIGTIMTELRTLELKMILCCGLVLEEHGLSPKAVELFESMRPLVDRKLSSDPSDAATLPLLAMVGGYYLLSSDEVLAWRTMGQVARHCLELGLHRRDGLLKLPEGAPRKSAMRCFWIAYMLDRRWSFETGLPFTIHDDNIDPKLPLPDEFPYLIAMITYSRLSAKVWRLVNYFEPAVILDLKLEQFEALDQEVLAWYDSVPGPIRDTAGTMTEMPPPGSPSYNLRRLQIWTLLRFNQIRIWLHMPVLHSASCIQSNMPLAIRAVDLARETIEYLKWLNHSTNLYKRMQVFYHQFLTSALIVLFLASTHAPVDFSPIARPHFYTALKLVKNLSAKSFVSQRLWRAVRYLKRYGRPVGLQDQDPAEGDDERPDVQVSGAGFGFQPSPGSGHPTRRDSLGGGDPIGLAGIPTSSMRASLVPSQVDLGGMPCLDGGAPPFNVTTDDRLLLSRPANGGGDYAGLGQTRPQDQVSSPDSESNGMALQNEMSRIFEGRVGAHSAPPAAPFDRSPSAVAVRVGGITRPSSVATVANSSGDYTPSPAIPLSSLVEDPAAAGAYRHFKDMYYHQN